MYSLSLLQSTHYLFEANSSNPTTTNSTELPSPAHRLDNFHFYCAQPNRIFHPLADKTPWHDTLLTVAYA